MFIVLFNLPLILLNIKIKYVFLKKVHIVKKPLNIVMTIFRFTTLELLSFLSMT